VGVSDRPIPRVLAAAVAFLRDPSAPRHRGAESRSEPSEVMSPAMPILSRPLSVANSIYLRSISEEADHGGIPYVDFLAVLSAALEPRSYFEIGTECGASAAPYSCPAVCVDPHFNICGQIVGAKKQLHLFQMTSDEFFAGGYLERILPEGPDIAFLDGMHRFECLLRDFVNTERHAHARTLVLMHDCLPQNQRMTSRLPVVGPEEEGSHRRFAWTGDVWKIIPVLKKYRPDLNVLFFDCPPTGLVAVSGLAPSSDILTQRYYQILTEFRDIDLTGYGQEKLWHDCPTLDSRALAHNPHDLTLFLNIY
jgi:hypothetical protein